MPAKKSKTQPQPAPDRTPVRGRGVAGGPPKWWGQYLLALMQTRSRAAAAQAAGTTRQNVRQLCEKYPDLAAEEAEAQEMRRAAIRGALFRIGTEGILLPVYALDKRTVIGYRAEWDARVLLKLAEAELKEYKSARVTPGQKEVTQGAGGGLSDADADKIVDAIGRAVDKRRVADRPKLSEKS